MRDPDVHVTTDLPRGSRGAGSILSTQYLSYGITDGRSQTDRDLALLRTVELERHDARRARRADTGLRRFLR